MVSKTHRVRAGLIFMLAAVNAFFGIEARAQGDARLPLERAVMSGPMAVRAQTKYQISADVAQGIVQACVDLAKANNGTVSVFILAPDGEIVSAHRMDGQNTINTQTAYKKAQTALLTRTSTRQSVNQFRTLDSKIIRLSLGLYLVAGGLPIVVDDQMIGSIGVGGANNVPGGDEGCAHQALTKVLGPQPPLVEALPPDPLGAAGRGGAGGGAGAGAGGAGGRGGAGRGQAQ
jgi:uncharacterized protein GlcG (DUF336 family)